MADETRMSMWEDSLGEYRPYLCRLASAKQSRFHYLEEMTITEICALMQKSQTAVAGLIHRGLASLREQMDLKPEP